MSSNYNTWGRKNNRWGNKNRKDKSNNTHYETSKPFNIIAGGICIFLLGALGLNLITWAISVLKSGIDTVSTVSDIAKL